MTLTTGLIGTRINLIINLTSIGRWSTLDIMTPKQLQKWRKDNGYSQTQLANVLKVDKMTISRWERGVRVIPSFLRLALRSIERGDLA